MRVMGSWCNGDSATLLRVTPHDLKLGESRGRVALWTGSDNEAYRRSNCSLPVDIWLGFRRATSVRFGLVLFPVPAHRTGQADFPHPALGKDTRCSV